MACDRKPGGSCSYVSHHYKSQCSQVYNYHRLLSWDKGRGLHMDIYKVDIPQHFYISSPGSDDQQQYQVQW